MNNEKDSGSLLDKILKPVYPAENRSANFNAHGNDIEFEILDNEFVEEVKSDKKPSDPLQFIEKMINEIRDLTKKKKIV